MSTAVNRKRRRRVAILGLAVATALIPTACGSSGSSDDTSAARNSPSIPGPLDTSSPIRINQEYIPAVTNLLPLLAPDYASKFNLTITSTTAQNVQSEITAAVRGDIDVFPATPAGVLAGRDSNVPLVMLASGATGSTQLLTATGLNVKEGDWDGFRTLVTQRKSAGKDLRFGSAVAGSANFIECQQSLAKHGISVGTDVKLVTIQNFPDQPAALEQGQVDVLCTPEPFATNTINSGKATFFATPFDTDSGDILGAITTTEKTLQDPMKKAALQRYLAVLQYTADQIKADPSVAVKRVMQLASTDEASAQRMLKYTQFTLAISKSNVQAMAKVMSKLGQTSTDLSGRVDSFIDTSLLPSTTAPVKSP